MTESQPTHQEIIAAYEALEKLCNRVPATRAAKLAILRALPPMPQPTMADIEWNDEEHYLAEAEHVSHGRVIMLTPAGSNSIKCLKKDNGRIFATCSYLLTLTGKRYTFTEYTFAEM